MDYVEEVQAECGAHRPRIDAVDSGRLLGPLISVPIDTRSGSV